MAVDWTFVVRTLPAATTTSLKGAFRIHLTPEALQHLKLKVGDTCIINGEDGTRGAAIAWRAADGLGKAPKMQPVKMNEVLLEAYGIKQGTQVQIEAATVDVLPASRIMLTEITPGGVDADDDCREAFCAATLVGLPIATGTTFDVRAGEGARKRRYYVERIETDTPQDLPVLAYHCDRTVLQILDAPLKSPTTTITTTQRPYQIDASKIGGLVEEIKNLNLRLRHLCGDARDINRPAAIQYNQSTLIHGYKGTGKSMLLDALEAVHGVRRVVRLDTDLLFNTPSKNESTINSAFQEAITAQPSVILIDDIHRVASATDPILHLTTSALTKAFDKIGNAQVLVIATAPSESDVDQRLLEPERLGSSIELPIPDAIGRTQILSSLLLGEGSKADLLAVQLAARTHGYTGRDLKRLFKTALFNALRRLNTEDDDYINITSPCEVMNPSITTDAVERSISLASAPTEHTTPQSNLLMSDFDLAFSKVRPSALREIIVEPPKVSFDDIGGSSVLRERFEKIINWPVLHRDKIASLGDKKPRRGILLYGPPGCSKTMTAQAVASTYGWNFLAIKGAELVSMYVGESERAVREIFRKARQAAPTIIFFDEIDSIATTRTSSSDASKSLNIVTTLLTEMDGFEATKHVLVLAATNKPETLDPAILRAGRFDEHIYLGPPNEDARREILRNCTKNVPGAIDIESLAVRSQGMSGAELKHAWSNACDIALERAVLNDNEVELTTDDVEAGIVSTTRVITKEMLHAYELFARRA